MLLHKSLIPLDLDEKQLAAIGPIATVIATPTGFVISSKERSLYWQFDLTKVEFGLDVLHLVKNRAGQYVPVWGSDLHESKDSWSSCMFRKNIDSFQPLCVIGVSADKKSFTAVFFISTQEPNNLDTQEDKSADSGDMLLKRVMPELAPTIDRWHAKHKLLKDTKTNDSLAALEAQVDLLTQWVAALIPDEYREKLLDAGVLKLKDTGVVVADVIAFKNALRERQKTYLTTTAP
jgi:hypothetical protein